MKGSFGLTIQRDPYERAASPLGKTRHAQKEPGSIINPVDAPMHIDLSYLESKKYTDGLNEKEIDVLRITLARRNDSLEAANRANNNKRLKNVSNPPII